MKYKEGNMFRIKWFSSRGWTVYYYTDGVQHGETTDRDKATFVSGLKFHELRSNRLIPYSADTERA